MTGLRQALAALAAVAAVAGCGDDGGGTTRATTPEGTRPPVATEPEDVLNHYLCYPIDNDGFKPPAGISLVDQFFPGRPRIVNVGRRDSLCNPVEKNDRGTPPRPEAHLVCYTIQGPALEEPTPVRLSNQFDRRQGGVQRYRVGKTVKMCLPSGKTKRLSDPDPPRIPDDVDHFKCYQLALVGTFKPFRVRLKDQFLTDAAAVNQAVLLCNPTEKYVGGDTHGPLKNPDAHLVCYPLDPIRAAGVPVRIANQFEADAKVTPVRPTLLCVPSTKTVGG